MFRNWGLNARGSPTRKAVFVGMGYRGCATPSELHNRAEFVQITGAGISESHVHDVQITKARPITPTKHCAHSAKIIFPPICNTCAALRRSAGVHADELTATKRAQIKTCSS